MSKKNAVANTLKVSSFLPGFAVALALSSIPSFAQNAEQSGKPLPTGVILLSRSVPPTGLQEALPAPIPSSASATHPLLASPDGKKIKIDLSKPITLQQAVSIALSTNRSIALAQEALLSAQGRTQEAKAGFNPTLGATFNYTRLDEGSTGNIGGASVTFVDPNQLTLGANFSLPVDITGLLKAAKDQANFQEAVARLDINRARNQAVLDTKSAFYDILRAKALVVVATETLQNSLDRLDDSQKRYKAGVVAKFDVLRAQTDVLNGQQGLIQARNQVSQTAALLNNTLGIEINFPLEISDLGAVETPPDTQNLPTDENANPTDIRKIDLQYDNLNLGKEYEALTQEALKTRPEILEGDASILAAKKGVVLAKRTSLPSLNVTAGYSYTPLAAGLAPKTSQAQIGLSINFPLFDGGVSYARNTQARAAVATAETNRRQSVDMVSLDVRSAYLSLVQARDRVAVSNQALVQAQEAFRLARVRYNAGVSAQAGISPLLEVSDAQNALTVAENNRVNALYDYNNNRAKLDKAAGRYSYIPSGEGYPKPPRIK